MISVLLDAVKESTNNMCACMSLGVIGFNWGTYIYTYTTYKYVQYVYIYIYVYGGNCKAIYAVKN